MLLSAAYSFFELCRDEADEDPEDESRDAAVSSAGGSGGDVIDEQVIAQLDGQHVASQLIQL